jgi:hypothetical protein
MQRIMNQNNNDKQLAERVLFWLCFALKPLTLKALQHALAVEPEGSELDEEDLPDEELLTSTCAGLVTVDRESNIIRLVHYTTQEYFKRIRTTQFPYAQTSIARTCLLYLSFDAFAEGYCRSGQELEDRVYKYPLLEYAARHWGDHARGNPGETIKELALEFFEHNSKLMCSNQVMHFPPYRYFGYSQDFPRHVTGLHIAASFGLAGIVQPLLLREGVDVNSKDDWGRTPLWLAAETGHERVVQLLLAHEGVDVNSMDVWDQTPLSSAAENGYERVVQLLLAHEGVDVNSRDEYDRTPPLRATKYGHEGVVQLLLAHEDVDVDSKDRWGRTPLRLAAAYEHERVVQLLLAQEGVDVNSKDR